MTYILYFVYDEQLGDIEKYFGFVKLHLVTNQWYDRNCDYVTLANQRCVNLFEDALRLRIHNRWKAKCRNSALVFEHKDDVSAIYNKLSRGTRIPSFIVCRERYE